MSVSKLNIFLSNLIFKSFNDLKKVVNKRADHIDRSLKDLRKDWLNSSNQLQERIKNLETQLEAQKKQ